MTDIQKLRDKIDKIDLAIIKRLAQRKKLSIQIGQLKKKENKIIKVAAREKEMIKNHDILCEQYDLQKSFIKKIFKIIMDNSKKLQK